MARIRANMSSGGGGTLTVVPLNGTASGNLTNPSYAFDGNPNTKSYVASSDGYLIYQFSNSVKVNMFGIRGNVDTPYLSPRGISIYGSNDGGTTLTLIAQGGCGYVGSADMAYILSTNENAYSYYKFDMGARTSSAGTYTQVSEIKMYYLSGLNLEQ